MNRLLFILILFLPNIFLPNPASLDSSFNGTGSIITTTNISSQTMATAVQPADGKIVVASCVSISDILQIALFRYNSDGSLDLTFGTDGTVYTTIPNVIQYQAFNLTLQADGQIILVGYATITSSPYNNQPSFIIVRYNSEGTVDASLYSGVALQANNNILITGTIYGGNGNLILFRLLPNGTLDSSFNTPFGWITQNDNSIIGSGVAVQSTGKIIVSGSSLTNNRSSFYVARYMTSGILDRTFGTNGISTFNDYGFGLFSPGGFCTNLLVQNDNIILTGYAEYLWGNPTQFALAIVRYHKNGVADATFGNNGYVATTIPNGTYLATLGANSATLEPNGQLIVTTALEHPTASVIARYNIDGSLDLTFSPTGYKTLQINNLSTTILSSSMQSDGKFLISGLLNDNQIFLTRFLGGFTLPSTNFTVNNYGYDSHFLSDFLYHDFYTTIISNQAARTATITAIDAIIANYETTYASQPNFNFITYLYLLIPELVHAQTTLIANYPDSIPQINLFFNYLNKRMNLLIIS